MSTQQAATESPADWLPKVTVRLEGTVKGVPVNVGTGFFYDFALTEKDAEWGPAREGRVAYAPTVITNKHVIEGCDGVLMHLSFEPPPERGLGSRLHMPIPLPLGEQIIHHPRDDVDLCAIPVAGVFVAIEQKLKTKILHKKLFRGHRLTQAERKHIRYIEPVVMIGYPIGLWDSHNNAPIVRRGSTATHPLVKYESKPEFMIDIACFPGSSGSPVFLFQDGIFSGDGVSRRRSTQANLLGILYAGPDYSEEGKLEAKPIPTNHTSVPVMSIPVNLGYVISADVLDDIEAVIRSQHHVSGAQPTEFG